MLPNTSEPVTLTVQQDPIQEYEETPIPEGYWKRPIYGANREWYNVAGNWPCKFVDQPLTLVSTQDQKALT